MRYKNESGERRIWPGISLPDNTTLELDAGEEVDLELPANFEDAFLKPTVRNQVVPVKQDESKDKEEPI